MCDGKRPKNKFICPSLAAERKREREAPCLLYISFGAQIFPGGLPVMMNMYRKAAGNARVFTIQFPFSGEEMNCHVTKPDLAVVK